MGTREHETQQWFRRAILSVGANRSQSSNQHLGLNDGVARVGTRCRNVMFGLCPLDTGFFPKHHLSTLGCPRRDRNCSAGLPPTSETELARDQPYCPAHFESRWDADGQSSSEYCFCCRVGGSEEARSDD